MKGLITGELLSERNFTLADKGAFNWGGGGVKTGFLRFFFFLKRAAGLLGYALFSYNIAHSPTTLFYTSNGWPLIILLIKVVYWLGHRHFSYARKVKSW